MQPRTGGSNEQPNLVCQPIINYMARTSFSLWTPPGLCAQSKHIIPQGEPFRDSPLPSGSSPSILDIIWELVRNTKPQALPQPNSETLVVGPSTGCLHKPSRWFPSTLTCGHLGCGALSGHCRSASASPFSQHFFPSCILSPGQRGHLCLPAPSTLSYLCSFHTYYAVSFLPLYLSLPLKCKPLENRMDILSAIKCNCD